MIRLGFLGAFIALLASGASAQDVNMQFNGVSRHYILHAPTGLPEKPALVFMIHGYSMTAQQEVNDTKFNDLSDKEKFVVVYPDAINKAWDLAGETDYKFLLAIADTMYAKYKIDRDRIYAAGFSMGNFMTIEIGGRYGDKFAAVGGASGKPSTRKYTWTRGVPFHYVWGTNDVETSAQFNGYFKEWVAWNQCTGNPTITKPYPPGNSASVVTQIKYSTCRDGVEAIADSIVGGVHQWPMDTRTKINTTEEIWAFFKRYTLKGPVVTGLPRSHGLATLPYGAASASYANGLITVQGFHDGAQVRVLDTRGRVAAEGILHSGQFGFRNHPRGVYQLMVKGVRATSALRLAVP